MDHGTYIEHLAGDGARMSAVSASNLDAEVPSCPGWTVEQLVRHTGEVYMHKAGVMLAGGTVRPDVPTDDGPEDRSLLLAWFDERLRDLIDILQDKDPAEQCWNFYGDNTVAFWSRRMAQETAVHRWDAETAAGSPAPINAALATDGVDEMLNVMIPGAEVPYEGPEGTVHLHSTDATGEWTTTLKNGEVPVTVPGHAKGDAAVRAPSSDLDLLLWRRIEPGALETFGDGALIGSFWRYLAGPGV